MTNVTVRWFDGYLEKFTCIECRFGSDLLWMKLATGENRHIPVRQVRWYSVDEINEKDGVEAKKV